VIFQGRQLVIPEKMDLNDAIKFLEKKRDEDEEEMVFQRIFKFRPYDGARAAGLALRKAFGMTRSQATYSMFGKNPPRLITINTDVGVQEQIPWGAMEVPLLPGAQIQFHGTRDDELGDLFAMTINGPRKYRFQAEGIFRLVEEELQTNSMYRGKAFDGKADPEFLDTAGVDPNKVVYSDEVITQLEANVWGLLRHTDEMRAAGIPLKRAVLLEGPYGTGKTLAAYLTAREAIANGWTCVYCRPGRDSLRDVMATAQLYQPSVVFFEDVDVVADASTEAANSVSELLDVFDGINAKGTEIMAILTTNHVASIHKGMMRPGRLDAVVHIGELDRAGVQRLTESLVPAEKLAADIDFDAVFEAMEGYLPAFCKEAVDRSIRYSIIRQREQITTQDLVDAANGLRPQFELMDGANEHTKPDSLGASLERVVRSAVNGAKITESGDEIYEISATEKSPLG
jgi:transitional endoplasmic reticulum ATPase